MNLGLSSGKVATDWLHVPTLDLLMLLERSNCFRKMSHILFTTFWTLFGIGTGDKRFWEKITVLVEMIQTSERMPEKCTALMCRGQLPWNNYRGISLLNVLQNFD